MLRTYITVTLVGLMMSTKTLGTESAKYQEVDKAVEIVRQLCLSGNKYMLSIGANGNLIFSRLIPGAEAKVEIDASKAYGAVNYFDESIRIYADEQIINCMKPYIAQILALIQSEKSGYGTESAMENDFASGDPALRARAFRQAFESVGVFYVALTPKETTSQRGINKGTIYECDLWRDLAKDHQRGQAISVLRSPELAGYSGQADENLTERVVRERRHDPGVVTRCGIGGLAVLDGFRHSVENAQNHPLSGDADTMLQKQVRC